jgi:23S rRNA pseudouridine1911/1915/1917 synthase
MSDRHVTLILDRPGERLDRVLADELPELSRAQCQRLIKDGQVTMGGKRVKASQVLRGGETVNVVIADPQVTELAADPIPLDIRYEDDDLILVNKPAGMVVHPSTGHERATLVNAILAYCPDVISVGGEVRPGIVHRLDKDTSGLVLVAKHDHSLRYMQEQFKERSVRKIYLALTEGQFREENVLIDAPIGRDPRDRKRMAVIVPESTGSSRPAQTIVDLLRYVGAYSLLECRPVTGRTHQIRIHLAYCGHPVVGDVVYGRRKQTLLQGRHFLHASELTFRRPSDGLELTVGAALPPRLQQILDDLAND